MGFLQHLRNSRESRFVIMGKKRKRDVELVILSDIHLGTYGCHAEELLRYLKTINPKKLILNGDIIDMWQFTKRYWPKSHMQVIKHITGLLAKNTRIVYLTGNHDEMLRKFSGFRIGSFQIDNKVVLKLNGKRAWIFHGDVFDVTMKYSKWLAKLGAVGYDTLDPYQHVCKLVADHDLEGRKFHFPSG